MMSVLVVKCPLIKQLFDLDILLPWNQVGEDVVSELSKAMERQGLDMKVTALVSNYRFYSNFAQHHCVENIASFFIW